ncbi:hypothetical protein LZ30DRAFT_252103 [Colletotrichum cereale]|nr:hypothetical protein LZ30DRAFT_252103 [Colletotrichum cereale]
MLNPHRGTNQHPANRAKRIKHPSRPVPPQRLECVLNHAPFPKKNLRGFDLRSVWGMVRISSRINLDRIKGLSGTDTPGQARSLCSGAQTSPLGQGSPPAPSSIQEKKHRLRIHTYC